VQNKRQAKEFWLPTQSGHPLNLQHICILAGPLYNPGVANALFGERLLLTYPKWMFGEWAVVSRFTNFSTPLGPRFIDPVALQVLLHRAMVFGCTSVDAQTSGAS
jgi:hypothetical protein